MRTSSTLVTFGKKLLALMSGGISLCFLCSLWLFKAVSVTLEISIFLKQYEQLLQKSDFLESLPLCVGFSQFSKKFVFFGIIIVLINYKSKMKTYKISVSNIKLWINWYSITITTNLSSRGKWREHHKLLLKGL